MNIFGLTPIDTALSAWGLNCAQNLMDFFFVQTHFGVMAFAIGFVWSLWQSTREANFKHLAIFIFVSLTIFFLILGPKRQESAFKSVTETYGITAVSAQFLKDSQTNANAVPLSLSYFAQMGDSVVMGLVYVIDNLLSHDLRFLNNPLGIEKVCLEANQALQNPIPDVNFKRDLDDFIYAHYLPSLNIYLNTTNRVGDLRSLWPGDSRIVNHYSSESQRQWSDLKGRISRIIEDPQMPWIQVKNVLAQFKINTNDIEDQMIASVIRGQIHTQNEPWWCGWVAVMQVFFSYSYGAANFLLYASFPILIIAIIIFRRIKLLLHYAEILIWIKSWILTAALSHYISLIAIQVQAQSSAGINWFWEYPYHVLVSIILLYVLPILSFIGINHSFQFINNTSLLIGREGGRNV